MARGQTLLVFSATDSNPLPTVIRDYASMVITVNGPGFNGTHELDGGPLTLTVPGTYSVTFPRLNERVILKGAGGGGGGGTGGGDSTNNGGGGGGGGATSNTIGFTYQIQDTAAYQLYVGAGGVQRLAGAPSQFSKGAAIYLQLPGGLPGYGGGLTPSGPNPYYGGTGGEGGGYGVGVGNYPGTAGATGGYVTYAGEFAWSNPAGAAGGAGGGGSQGGGTHEGQAVYKGGDGGTGGSGKDQGGGVGGRGGQTTPDTASAGATASGQGGFPGRQHLAGGGGGGGGGVALPGGYFGGGGGGGGGSPSNGGDGGKGSDGAMQIAKWAVYPAKGLWVVGNGHPVVRFASWQSQAVMFPAVMPRQYGGGTIDVTLMWSGQYHMGAAWRVSVERHFDAFYLQSRNFTTPTAIYSETNPAVPDSATYVKMVIPSPCLAGEHFRLLVQADPYGADCYLHSIELRESRF